jgi:NADPH:quinone reductase-like Zn-dependent oxidoreductase
MLTAPSRDNVSPGPQTVTRKWQQGLFMDPTRRAVVLTGFGDSSNLKPTDLPVPRLRHPDELLIRVAATSVNPIEWKMREGLGIPKWLWRRAIGSPMVLGLDFSGEVAAVGGDSGPFQPGDAVMGALPFAGSYTTHLALRIGSRRTAIVHKPAELTHTQAALVPFAGLVAYAGLMTYGTLTEPSPGARILIVGASGGVGHLAVQMAANALSASLVAGVSSSRNEHFVRSCGADIVIPHDRIAVRQIPDQFPDWTHTFDLVFDCVGIDEYFTDLAAWLLKPRGRFVTAALPSFHPGRPGEDVGLLDGGELLWRVVWRRLTGDYRLITGLLVGLPAKDGLPTIVRWITEGKLAPHTASTYRLEEIAAAHRESEKGRTVGKIAIEMP